MPAVRDKQGQFVKPPEQEPEEAGRQEPVQAHVSAAALEALIVALRHDRLAYHNLVLLARRTQMSRRGPLTDFVQALIGLEDHE